MPTNKTIEVSISADDLSSAEINRLIRTAHNSLIEIFTDINSASYSYTLGNKTVDRTKAIIILTDVIKYYRTLLVSIPQVEYVTQDYDISDYGEDSSEYIGDVEST